MDILFPESISPLVGSFLIFASFFTSALTAALGLGGGAALIAIMANLMPIAALVPVHGAVQMGSNAGRALVQIRHVDWPILAWFSAGAVAGAAVGGSIAVELPAPVLRLGIGLFILWMLWGKVPGFEKAPKRVIATTGFVAAALSMFFGASGPIGGAVLSKLGLSRHGYVATQAVTALVTHVLKIVAFGLLGFVFAPWLGLIVAMIASGFLGTLFGSRLLTNMKEETFRKGFKLVMTVLALNLLWRAMLEMAGS
ncbi:TSUP family transporter [Stappia sp. GBMRC 2046]|uniref:Probable membrane transporter protein n=1 Tax=Stappia sediminis TaxID=2692190 RepID=A0A7X3LTK5_9HYPH|nr:sulfite exporter TauE/SafE family protein [Stappia sediminis]MXN64872.1 TSUP family transporter [Stappia sediminis]